MNPDQSSREEIELRITMLLLGELPAEEAEALRQTIAQDTALKKLHDELRSTIGLVREVQKNPADANSENPAPLKLSVERRQKLLAHFKTLRPQESFWIRPMKLPALIPALVVVAIISLLAALLLPALSKAKYRSTRAITVSASISQSKQKALEEQMAEAEGKSLASIDKRTVAAPALPPDSAPANVTLTPQPVVAPPLVRIALPATESPGQTTPTGSLAESGASATGGVYSQNIVGYVNTPIGSGLPAAPTADSVGVQTAISSGGTINSQPPMEQAEKQWVAPSGQVAGTVSAETRSEGLRNTGGFGGFGGFGGGGGGGGGGAGGFKPADASTLTVNDSSANRSRTGNGLSNQGEAVRQKTPMGSTEATAAFDMPVAAPPAPDQVPAATAFALAGNDSGNLPQAGLEKKFGGNEMTKGASQLRDTEPALDSKHGFYKFTPLPGAQMATAEGENADTGLAMNVAPAETSPALAPPPPQLQANDGKQVANSFDFKLGNNATTDRNGLVASASTPPATAGPVMVGDIPVTGMLFTSGAGEAAPKQANKSESGELALNGNNSWAGGTTFGGRRPTNVRAQDSFQTGLAKDDVSGLCYLIVTNGIAPVETQTMDLNQALARYSELTGKTVLRTSLPETAQIQVQSAGSKEEEIQALQAALAKNETSLIPVGDKFLKAVPADQANAAGAALPTPDSSPVLTEADRKLYDTERRKLQDLEATHKMLNLKLTANSIDAKVPTTSMVQITDEAEPSTKQTFWQSLRGEYASTAKIKVENNGGIISGINQAAATAQPYDPYFIQTTFEVMQSSAVLGRVVDALHLDTAWADKNGGQKLTKSEAIECLKSQLSLRPVKNTKLVAITVTSDKPGESAKLANAVALAYQNYRVANNQQTAAKGLEVLQAQYLDESNRIIQIRSNLDKLTPKPAEPVEQPDLPVRQPPANAPVPQPEVLTSENAFSTFSLNVSDVSFKLAEASLEQGQMPDAAGIRSEEFINAFDYRDPEAAAGKPMAFTSERARYPFAHNRELLRFSIKTAAAGRPAGRALNLVLLLDNSGSMERADRVAIIREALQVLAGQLQPQDTVSVVTFARTARLWADGVAGDKAGETLAQVGGITPEGGTNLEEAMRLAYETAHRHYLANGMNRVVLLTDGAANLGNVDPAVLKQKVEAQRKQGIALDCFGIGFNGYDDNLLEQLSRNGDGRYAFINSPEEAGSEFAAKLAGALQIAAADVKVQVEFNPQRVISYRQIGYAKHQLTKEQFRDNTVDAAEIAAQEAGNALYTVETKPDGTGPVATVRVRYKVPGTADYHEWSWDVAYEGNVPAMEQASAAMRLAGTASAFSEWLAVSPFAQEVTPDELLKIMSGVPEVYGADERPKKLEWMIRQAKSLSGK